MIDETRADIYNAAGQTGKDEVKLQRRLTACAAVGLASIPFTGPFGLAYVGGVVIGKLIRRRSRKDTREAYEAQKLVNKLEAREQYLEQIRETAENMKSCLEKMSPFQLNNVSDISLRAKRSIFGGTKLEVRIE